jgi:hypothetical protein
MNASTSALGRALGMMGFGIEHKMASKQEVLARQQEVPTVTEVPAVYDNGDPVPDPFTDKQQTTNVVQFKNPKGKASDKQIGMIRALARGKGFGAGKPTLDGIIAIIGREIKLYDELTKADASKVIDAWK